MKGRLAAFVGVFCIALLIVSGAYAGKPPKDPKSPKPGNITKECIVFTGALESVPGGTVVEGCCPNAGPFPAYTMTLNVIGIPPDTYEGTLFINGLRTEEVTGYIVQFLTWNWDTDIPKYGDYFFEIRGGDVVKDRKNKVTTVTFDGATATAWVYYDMNCEPCALGCDDPCGGVNPTCDDFCDPDCPYPCNEPMTIDDVSFVLVRTPDLTYCQ